MLPALSVALVLATINLSFFAACLPSIESPCTACQSIAKELRIRMQNERPRNHLDMRHRLDSSGQRYGKVIDYKISELRAVELLDGLCKDMNQYIIVSIKVSESGRTTDQWRKLSGEEADNLTNSTRYTPVHIETAKQKQLLHYCGAVMEELEGEIEQAIMGGKMNDVGAIESFLCLETVKACPDGTIPAVFIDEPAPLPLEGAQQLSPEGKEEAPPSDAADAPVHQEL